VHGLMAGCCTYLDVGARSVCVSLSHTHTHTLHTHTHTIPQQPCPQTRAGLVDLGVLCPIVDAVHYRNSFALHLLLSWALPATAAASLGPVEVQGLGVEALGGGPQGDSGSSGGGGASRQPAGSLAALQACFTEQDRYGQTLLHVAIKSKAAGFARLFVRLRRLVADGKRASVQECVGCEGGVAGGG
jgi:hypothetical protein